MRIALTTALVAMAAIAFADEPSAPDQKAEATAEAASDKPKPQQPTATETQANAEVQGGRSPSSRPTGYRPSAEWRADVLHKTSCSAHASPWKTAAPRRSCVTWNAQAEDARRCCTRAGPAQARSAPNYVAGSARTPRANTNRAAPTRARGSSWRFVLCTPLAYTGTWIALLTPVLVTIALKVRQLTPDDGRSQSFAGPQHRRVLRAGEQSFLRTTERPHDFALRHAPAVADRRRARRRRGVADRCARRDDRDRVDRLVSRAAVVQRSARRRWSQCCRIKCRWSSEARSPACSAPACRSASLPARSSCSRLPDRRWRCSCCRR